MTISLLWNNKWLTSSVELEGSLESDALLGGRRLGVRSLSSVQSVDVGLMVLGVVQFHDLRAIV